MLLASKTYPLRRSLETAVSPLGTLRFVVRPFPNTEHLRLNRPHFIGVSIRIYVLGICSSAVLDSVPER